jgi:long-chain acyl-CoA synthetase
LDLGFDSIERIELLAELEQRFGTTISAPAAAEIFTVRQLVDAVRIDKSTVEPLATRHDKPWAAILRDLPARTDARLGWLLRRRPIAAPVLFAVLRIARVLLLRVRVNGLANLPASGPYIITPNHQSYVDPFILCGILPYRVFKDVFFVGAIEYFETRFTRWVARTANLVPVDPDSNLVPAMQAGAFGLTHGKILLLFPEGERSIDGTVKTFKKGAPILAQHLRVPLIPVALKGIHELWPRGRGITWRLLAPWSGHRVRIEIGSPITPAADVAYNDAAMRLRDRVNALWQALSS